MQYLVWNFQVRALMFLVKVASLSVQATMSAGPSVDVMKEAADALLASGEKLLEGLDP